MGIVPGKPGAYYREYVGFVLPLPFPMGPVAVSRWRKSGKSMSKSLTAHSYNSASLLRLSNEGTCSERMSPELPLFTVRL